MWWVEATSLRPGPRSPPCSLLWFPPRGIPPSCLFVGCNAQPFRLESCCGCTVGVAPLTWLFFGKDCGGLYDKSGRKSNNTDNRFQLLPLVHTCLLVTPRYHLEGGRWPPAFLEFLGMVRAERVGGRHPYIRVILEAMAPMLRACKRSRCCDNCGRARTSSALLSC